MNAKQVAPPFVKPQAASSDSETKIGEEVRFGPEDEVDDVATVPVEGLFEAVQELGEASVSAEREQSVVELPADPDVVNESYWASGGQVIGGLTLGNKSPSADATLAKVGVTGKIEGKSSNPFKPPEPNQSNPFAKRVIREAEPNQIAWMVPEGTPTWNEFVKFVMEHGDHIRRVRYPNPPRNAVMIAEMNRMDRIRQVRGEAQVISARPVAVIDTVWKGVPVFDESRCMIEHEKYGWAEWSDCQS
jgi:hypothetical protein